MLISEALTKSMDGGHERSIVSVGDKSTSGVSLYSCESKLKLFP